MVCEVVVVVDEVSGVWLEGEVLCGDVLLGVVDCGLELEGEVLLGV